MNKENREENHQTNDTRKVPGTIEFVGWEVPPNTYMMNERKKIKPRLRNVNLNFQNSMDEEQVLKAFSGKSALNTVGIGFLSSNVKN